MNVDRRDFLRQVVRILGASVVAVHAPGLIAAPSSARILNLRHEVGGDMLRLVFDLSDEVAHSIMQLSGPDRLVVDFQQAAIAEGVSLALRDAPNIQRLRSSARNDADYRVVFDLVKGASDARSYYLDYGDGAMRQLVIELKLPSDAIGSFATARTAEPARASVAVRESVPSREATPSREAPPSKPDTQAQAASQQRTAKHSRPDQRGLRDIVIAIDAGHGGKDPGAVGKGGTQEKDVVLQVARKLERLLARERGYKPVLTRDSDVFLPLRERIRRARASQADLFISVHADASPNRMATGSSVYVLSNNGASSEAAKVLAEKENAADLIGGVSLNDKDQMLASVLLDLSQRHTIESSRIVAERMLGEMARLSDVHSRNVERAGFVVLKSPDIPSVLVETAFISNPQEEKRLRTDAYQNKVAESLLSGIKTYFRDYAPEGSLIASNRGSVDV
ncbi:MAG: N-acetylmuramoyl-L-alanine amidase [Thiotrichales bacterium]